MSKSDASREGIHAQVTTVLRDGDVPVSKGAMDADETVLNALGYKQEFKREFSLWTTFCVSFAVLGLLPSFASTLYYGKGHLRATIRGRTASDRNRNGLRRHRRYGLGLDYCHGFHPVRSNVHGRTLLGNAYQVVHSLPSLPLWMISFPYCFIMIEPLG